MEIDSEQVFAARDFSRANRGAQHNHIDSQRGGGDQEGAQNRGKLRVQRADAAAHQHTHQRGSHHDSGEAQKQAVTLQHHGFQQETGLAQLSQNGASRRGAGPAAAELENRADQPDCQNAEEKAVFPQEGFQLQTLSLTNQGQKHPASRVGCQNAAGGEIGENGQIHNDKEQPPKLRPAGFDKRLNSVAGQKEHD